MGQYLSSPVTTKESEEGYADGVAFGMAAMQGWRVFMEDAHITELAYDSETQPPTSLFSVFDGHGGKGVALFAAKHLPKMLRETREYKSGDLSGALVAAYYEVDRLLRTPEGESEVVELSGSTHKGAGHQPSTLFGEVPDVLEAEASLASGAEEERAAAESGEEVPEARSSDFLQSHLMRASLISPSVTSRAPARVSPFPPSLFDAPSDPPSSAAGAEEGSPTPAGGAPSAAPEPPPPGAAPDRPSPRKPSTPGQPPKPPAPPSKGPPVSGEALGAQESGEALPSPRPSMLFPDVAPLELSPAPDPEALATLTSGGSQASSAMDRLDTVRYERDPAAQSPGSSAAGSSGCTALSVLVRGTQVLVANTGDSRCVLSRRGAAVALTLDHKPILFEEARRIIRAGGFVRDNRINGALNVSRAMGDLDFKANDRLPQGEQMVVVTPDVEVLRLADGDEFVILACDGIWDVLSNQEAVEFVRRRLKNGLGLKEIAEQMCDACLAPDLKGLCRGADNMSVVLVHFPKYARFDSFWKNVWGALWPEAALRQLVGKR